MKSITEERTESPTRMHVRHLLGWIFVSAAMLAVTRRSAVNQNGLTDDGGVFKTFITLFAVFDAMIFGMLAVSLITLAVSWWRSCSAFQHPGHWILLIEGTAFCAMLLMNAVNESFNFTDQTSTGSVRLFGIGTLLISSCRVFGLLFWIFRFKLPLVWRYFASVLIIGTVLESVRVCSYLGWTNGLPGMPWQQELAIVALMASGLVVAVAGDRNLLRRDWLHYAGLAVVAWNLISRLGWAAFNISF